jgi:MFS family permease
MAQSWTHVLAVRVADRIGKGIRSAPRDALLATWATADTRGKIFGFHQAMDHVGAIVGPIAATVFLLVYPGAYRALFAVTIIPGAIAVVLILLIRKPVSKASDEDNCVARGLSSDEPGLVRSLRRGFGLPHELNAFFLVLVLFTLGNSTDAFLLLRLTDVAGSAKYIPLMWAALHVVKASVSFLGGRWSDRIGRRMVIALGWIVYALVYVGFATATTLAALLTWFLVYGFYFGFAEGTEKALVADLAPRDARGFAFGLYNAVLGIGALLASVLFALLWNAFGSGAAFGTGAALATAATALLFMVVRH